MKKSDIICIALLLALAPAAYASNNLVQMDLKRTSGDSVDVTLFTSNGAGENVLARKKSDNKYVILIPKVQSSGFKSLNLSGVKDLVSDVDVKTVNDTTGGYTKVTLITTKPLDIKTRTQKSAPLTEEQKEYNTLMAQANAIKKTASQPQKVQQPKTEVTVNKAPAVKTEAPKTKSEPPKKIENKPDIKLTEINPETVQKQIRKAHLQDLINEVKQEQEVPAETPDISSQVPDAPVLDIQDMPKPETPKQKSKLPLVFGIIAGLFCLSKLGKPSVNTAVDYPVMEELPQEIAKTPENYDDNGLTWQEKYKLYVDKSAAPVARANNKGNYAFIKKAVLPDEIEAKRAALEQMVTEVQHSVPEIEPEIVEVQSEDDVIRKAVKFKAFENQAVSLKMTSRNKSRFKKYEVEIPLHEQKNIDLGDSLLHTNPRSLKDANLKVSDVDKNRIKYEPKEYIMSSIDEYFSIIDKEQAAKAVSNPIAKSGSETKTAYQKGLIVKSGFNIDENKGIYLVNKNGQNALVGKVKDEVFVLKKFDTNISNPIQVRHDNKNVYMVKAGGFKSLVEVNEDKMGVLIEL